MLPGEERAALQAGLATRRPAATDLHVEPGGEGSHLSVVAPLFDRLGGGAEVVGAVVLTSGASHSLFPILSSWPTASASAETVLVRKDGDSALYLNEPRHRPGTAFHLRVPLSKAGVVGVQAVLGRLGLIEGLDYRGVAVLADARGVPGTPWVAVTKIDADEALRLWRTATLQLASLVGGMLAAVSLFFFAIWQRRTRVQYHALREAIKARAVTAGRLEAILESSQHSIVARDAEGRVMSWNSGAERLYGYSAAEMIGDTGLNMVPPEDLEHAQAVLARVAAGETVAPFETQRRRKDGSIIDVYVSLSAVRDDAGRIVGTSAIARDITEEKRFRRDLDRLAWMLSPGEAASVPEDVAGAVDRTRGGHAVREVLNAAGASLLSETAADFHSLMGTCFSVYESNGDLAYGLLVSEWCRFLHATGSCGGSGGACGHAEALMAIGDGAAVDRDCPCGLHVHAVPIRTGDEVVGALTLGYGDPPRDRPTLEALGARLELDPRALDGPAAAYESRPPFILELAKRRLDGAARLLGEIVQQQRADALLRKTRDELERSNQELERFAYVASHDLQEPLRMVASYTQLLAQRYKDQLDGDAREFIDYAVDGARRMKQLIEDLLAYSRVTGKGRPLAAVDSQYALWFALRNLQMSINESAADIRFEDLPPLQADNTQIIQLFQNLVSNAIKFRQPGVRPEVRITAERWTANAGFWLFRLSDNGIGIERKYFDRVFQIFQRLHTRQEYPGTGIGLTLCQRIVERHGGRIWLESEPGRGTTFLFTLPAVEEEKEAA
jgi:PAS domain S-box-containing protein